MISSITLEYVRVLVAFIAAYDKIQVSCLVTSYLLPVVKSPSEIDNSFRNDFIDSVLIHGILSLNLNDILY